MHMLQCCGGATENGLITRIYSYDKVRNCMMHATAYLYYLSHTGICNHLFILARATQRKGSTFVFELDGGVL